jgi:hypothetical protein
MFELFTNIYAEKVESGRYRVFRDDGCITVFVNINRGMSFKQSARLLRNIAKQIVNIQDDSNINNIKGGHYNEK